MILTFLFCDNCQTRPSDVKQSINTLINSTTFTVISIFFPEFYLLLDSLQFKIESKMTTNFKYTLTKSLRNYTKYIPQLTKPVLRVLIQGKRETAKNQFSLNLKLKNFPFAVSVHYIESRNCPPEVLDLALTKLSQTGSEIPENFYELFAAILQIMQLYLRTPKGSVREDELRECLKELRFSDECIGDIVKVLNTYRDSLTQNYCEVKSLRTPPKRFNWCINLSLIERYAREVK